MFGVSGGVLQWYRAMMRRRREAKFQALVADVLDDCFDKKRQSERLARWARQPNGARVDPGCASPRSR
jgi:hypothetical protein